MPIASKCLNQDSSSSTSAKPMAQLQCQDACQGILGSQEAWVNRKKEKGEASRVPESTDILNAL